MLAAGITDATARRAARALARFDDPELEVAGAGLPAAVGLLPLLGLDPPTAEGLARAVGGGRRRSRPARPARRRRGRGARGRPRPRRAARPGRRHHRRRQERAAAHARRRARRGVLARPPHLRARRLQGRQRLRPLRRRCPTPSASSPTSTPTSRSGPCAASRPSCATASGSCAPRAPPTWPSTAARAGGRTPLPRLVVVVDEFATLKAELPDFVDSLVGVAQRGRSLGRAPRAGHPAALGRGQRQHPGQHEPPHRAAGAGRGRLRRRDRPARRGAHRPRPARAARSSGSGPGEVEPIQTALATGVRARPVAGRWRCARSGSGRGPATVATAERGSPARRAPTSTGWSTPRSRRTAGRDGRRRGARGPTRCPPRSTSTRCAVRPTGTRPSARRAWWCRSRWPTIPTPRPSTRPAGCRPTATCCCSASGAAAPRPPARRSCSRWPAGRGPTTCTCTCSTSAPASSLRWPGSPTSARWCRPAERERQARLVRLAAGRARPPAGPARAAPPAPATPASWSCSTASAAFRAEWEDSLHGVWEDLQRVFADGPEVGVHTVVTADRIGRGARRDAVAGPPAVAVPDGRSARAVRRSGCGPARCPTSDPGGPSWPSAAQEVQVARPAGGLDGRGRAAWPPRPPTRRDAAHRRAIGVLPDRVDPADLVGRLRVDGDPWASRSASPSATLGPGRCCAPRGRARAGGRAAPLGSDLGCSRRSPGWSGRPPPRSPSSAVAGASLRAGAASSRRPGARAEARSRDRSTRDRAGTGRVLVLVDDADLIDDDDGALAALLAARRPGPARGGRRAQRGPADPLRPLDPGAAGQPGRAAAPTRRRPRRRPGRHHPAPPLDRGASPPGRGYLACGGGARRRADHGFT